MTTATIVATIDSSGARTGAAQFNTAIKSMGGAARDFTNNLFSIRGAIAGLAGALTFREFVKAGDSFAQLNARLALFAGEGQTAASILDGLTAAAQRSRAPVSELANVYQRNAAAIGQMGLAAGDGIKVAETLAKVTTISGVNAQQASAGMMQLSQAIASGKFQGDEFRSVAENIPELMRLFQQETGKTAAELRKLASEGKFTGDVIVNSLLNAAERVDKQFASMPQTVEQASNAFTASLGMMVGSATDATGANRALAEAINEWTKTLSSSGAMAAVETFAGWIKSLAEYAGAAARELRLMGIEAENNKNKGGWLAIFGDAGPVGPGRSARSPTAGQKDSRTMAEEIDKWQASVQRGDVSATGGRREIKFGDGSDDAEVKRKEKLNRTLREQLALEKLRADVTRAQIGGDDLLAQTLREQMEIRQRITEDMRKANPEKAAALEEEIRQQNRLAIVLENVQARQEYNKQFADDFAGAIAGGFEAAIAGGKSFKENLKEVGRELLMLITRAALLEPLAKSLSGGVSKFLDASGINIGSLLSGALGGGDVGMGSWTPFAKGGVVDSPTGFAMAGGMGVAGEAGPEAILPISRGRGGVMGVQASGLGGTTVNNYFTVEGDATESTIRKMEQMAERVYAKREPGTVKRSADMVAQKHRANAGYLRR